MKPYLAEFIGTAILIILGNGVVANVVLNKTKGHGSGWIVICFGWAMAVFVGVYSSVTLGGSGHLNPAVSVALAAFGDFSPSLLAGYVIAQVTGAFTGSVIVWLSYRQHMDATPDQEALLAMHCTSPAIRSVFHNSVTELVGTFILVFGALAISKPSASLGTIDALPVALLVLGIGLSLGGPTGYAINPARDLGPRLAHAILPLKYKGGEDWSYAPVPILAPLLGGLLAGWLYNAVML